ncbi:NUDIX hydrolase [Fulvimarina endophytica]|nr:NUDIX domain-containing protein [Fulvimarina endophytica]
MNTNPDLASDWTPPERIRPIAIGLIVADGHVLLMEVRDRTGFLKGFRPVGGGIEFGESAEQALLREFREELGWEPHAASLLTVCENRFEHNGAPGHEIVFVFSGERPEGAPAPLPDTRLDFLDHGVATSIRWVAPDELERVPIYPEAIEPLLRTAIAGT